MKIIAALAFISTISASQLVAQKSDSEVQQQQQIQTSHVAPRKHVYSMVSGDHSVNEQIVATPNSVSTTKMQEKVLPNGGMIRSLAKRFTKKTLGLKKEDFLKITADMEPSLVEKAFEDVVEAQKFELKALKDKEEEENKQVEEETLKDTKVEEAQKIEAEAQKIETEAQKADSFNETV